MGVIYKSCFQSTRDHLKRVLAAAGPEIVREAIKAGMTPYESGRRRKWQPISTRSRRRR
jgi:hypothetical protein